MICNLKLHALLSRLSSKTERIWRGRRADRPVHFLHIGKTGGTAFKHAIASMPGQIGRDEGLGPAIHLHPHSVKLRDIPEGDRFFFFLRDPISRFVSGFYSRQRQGQPRHFVPWRPNEKEAFRRFSTPNQLALALHSEDAEEKFDAERAMQSIAHVRDSYWKWFESEEYFLSRLGDLFFIGFQERLSADFEVLKSKLELPNCLLLPEDPILAHANLPGLDKTLQDDAVKNLRRWYAEDFLFLDLCHKILRVNSSIRS